MSWSIPSQCRAALLGCVCAELWRERDSAGPEPPGRRAKRRAPRPARRPHRRPSPKLPSAGSRPVTRSSLCLFPAGHAAPDLPLRLASPGTRSCSPSRSARKSAPRPGPAPLDSPRLKPMGYGEQWTGEARPPPRSLAAQDSPWKLRSTIGGGSVQRGSGWGAWPEALWEM